MDAKLKKKLLWATLISAVLMFFLLLKVDWEQFTVIAGRMDLRYLIASFSVFMLGNLVRTFRFRQLDHTDKKLKLWWDINAFYNFITSTLPGGAGEAATVYVLKWFSVINIIGAFRILLISRLMDLSALTALFFLASIHISNSVSYREAAVWLSGTLFLLTLTVLTPASERFVLRLLQRLPGNFMFVQKVCEKLNELLEIVKARQNIRYHLLMIIQSVLVVSGGIVTLHLLMQAFGINFLLVQSVYCYGVYLVFQIVPVQGIAGLGTQAAWWALALNAAGYKTADAIAVGFVLYGTFYFFIAILGLSAVIVWLINRKSKSY